MDKILSGLLFPQKNTEQQVQAPPNTIIIDTSSQEGYFTLDSVNKNVYNKFIKDYSKFGINDNITINITSMGGEIFYILLIANIINKHKGVVIAYINKYCMGGAMLIALACNHIRMKQSACLGYMNFYNMNLPVDKFHNAILNLENNEYIPPCVKPFLTKIETNLSFNRKDTERQIEKILKKNYDHESIVKIIDYFYKSQTISDYIFMEDIPKFINIIYEDMESDEIDSDNGDISLD